MQKEFQILYFDMYPKLVRQAAFILGDKSAAEDMAQEALLRLHNNEKYIDNPSSWLIKVTNNLCFNYMRNEGNRRRREETVVKGDTRPPAAASAENMAIEREEFHYIREALKKLKPRDRMVLLMKFSGHSYDEISAVIETNKNSVGKILARARKRFKQEYELIYFINQER